jgi:CHAD domain-containing protein
MQKTESVRLLLPGDVGPECLQDEWQIETRQQESRVLTFWDTFEWGLWFGEHVLYSCGDVYHLCACDDGWLGAVLCEEEATGRRRFWGEFETASMRTALEEMLGLRGLAPVVEGTFLLRQSDVRNEMGKIVCRLEWTTVSTGDVELLHSCRVLPLLGYETESARVEECLAIRGAKESGEGPVEVLLSHAERVPQKYTLKPSFGLEADTAAREAVGRIVRTILDIAGRNVPGILDDLDTEFLHDYRICLRKIRSVLTLVKEVYPADETTRMRKILGDLARQTNRLRDLDVYLLARDEYLGLLPPALRPPLDGMFEDFAAERAVELRHTAAKMRAHASRKLMREMKKFFSEETRHKPSPHAELPVGPLVFRSTYKRYRKICKIAAELGAATPDEVVHQIRIECKKLRYLMEFFSELIAKEEGAALNKLLRRLQGRLGDFNDASVQQKSLLDYWEQHKSGSHVALGVGGLVSILYHRQQQTRALIEQSLEEFCGGSTAAAFKRTFKLPAAVSAAEATRNTKR